ncbi:Glycosyltransferase involved in cell wall bisynthesis [Cyclobacterium xiamenense]|uniref:Glycosyltransferase involved in cell wall bisynthesis n=1 Tax=Cyclobacterium xiamenense TaxID=1297121 RepID=A0A1H7ATS8_9BACT|nr:glycosyltransferase [Cyclobacterium xiamenense]SEJ69003.1 Glycosyltransferase involved in cell wall bisynthesis [Cyclobacterium xiamenense]
MSILHLSFDYPGFLHKDKTKAVKNLIDAQNEFDNLVFSMKRSANPFSDYRVVKTDYGFGMRVFGLPFGIFLTPCMRFAGRRILKTLRNNSVDFDMIHAHKLTFEGIIAFSLAERLGIPYLITIRGDSDLKVIRAKWWARPLYGKILCGASKILFLTPWTRYQLEHYFPAIPFQEKAVLIPNIIEPSRQVSTTCHTKNNKFVSVFKLDSYKRKNIKRVIKAMDALHASIPSVGLDIIGPGTEKSKKVIQKYIDSCKYPSRFNLLGSVPNEQLVHVYPKYLGLVLPSNPETFGLVFIEALNSGLPIIYAKNAGVDGFFEEYRKVGVKVDSRSVKEISDALKQVYENNEAYTASVQHFKDEGKLDAFSRKRVTEDYLGILRALLA